MRAAPAKHGGTCLGVGWIAQRELTPDAWNIPALAAEIIAARVPPVVDSDGRTAVDSDHVGA